jgi:hypothetical protein
VAIRNQICHGLFGILYPTAPRRKRLVAFPACAHRNHPKIVETGGPPNESRKLSAPADSQGASSMGTAFWLRRFTVVFGGAFVLIAAAQLLRGRTLEFATFHGLVWAAVSATIFTGARFYQARQGQHCAICRDTPEMRARDGRQR